MTPRLALKQRPDATFEKLYRQHVGDVYHYSLAVLGNPADAEDVTQTTFLNAYRAIHEGERPRKPAAWLRTIAHNVCRQRWRQASRRPHEVAELDEFAGAAGASATAPGADEEADGHSAADITRALQGLPFNQRTALVMRELEGRRQAEIARELDLSESAVEALLFRARRAMREQLESSITCGEAARAISRQLDRSLSREERSSLRAHLRTCEECATFARQARAQRGALKALGAVPLPAALLAWKGGAGGLAAAAAGAGSGTGGIAAAAGGTSAVSGSGLAAAAGGSSGVGASAAAAGGGTAAAFGLKVAAGIVAVAVVAGGGERVLHATEKDGGHPAAGASQATDGPAATPSSRRGTATTAPSASSPAAESRSGAPSAGARSHAHPGSAGGHANRGRSGAAPGHANDATPVRAHGTPAQSNGTPAPSNGNATRAHGTPPQSQGAPTRAHGSPPPSNGSPTRSHGSPRPPSTAHGPGVENGNATHPPRTPPGRSDGDSLDP